MTSDPPTPAAVPPETRISTLVGDRVCIKCGYNLVGQPILRENHYDMLIVRCPECATVASVQEYPLLGRWANRWAAALAAIWVLLLTVLWFGSAGALFGFAMGGAELGSENYSAHLYSLFTEHQSQSLAGAAQNSGVALPGNAVIIRPNTADFMAWWKQQDHAALLHEAGGIFSGVSWIILYLWMWLIIASVILGVMWATMLVSRSRGGLLVWGLVIVLTAAAIGLIPLMEWLAREPSWTRQAAAQQVAPIMMLVTLGIGYVAMSIGMIFGRNISRSLIKILLPPRMRSALAFLWLTDSLEPPSAKR